jgi:hypothetical protein
MNKIDTNFLKKNKGFTIAVIVVIILILIAGGLFFQEKVSAEEMAEAQLIYLQNEEYYSSYLGTIENEKVSAGENDLKYLEEIEKDVLWLKEKNKEMFQSFVGERYNRMVAINVFGDYLLGINESFAFEFLEDEKEKIIEMALDTEFEKVEILKYEDFEEGILEESKEDIDFAKNIIGELEKEYYKMKINEIYESEGLDEKFLNAKKIILFFS